MKVLIIGSGGREHALAWKISQSQRVDKIYCAPGNGGTKEFCENIDIKSDDIQSLLNFALRENIDLTIVGPEDPLVMGIVDLFKDNGLKIFGPDKKAAQLEGSKEYSKVFMEKHGVATAKYESFTDYESARNAIKNFSLPLVIKADGLCLGKGVFICKTIDEADEVLKDILEEKIFKDQGDKVVIEEFLNGIEASLLCLVKDGDIIPMESAKDYKKIFDKDEGLNTGGVGCYSPSPLFTKELNEKIRVQVLDKIKNGLRDENLYYSGILFIGLMIENNNPKVLEFNVRFGDPETEVLMPRLESDLIDIIEKSIDNSLVEEDLKWSQKHCLTVVATSGGYPQEYKKGYEISGFEKLDENIMVFHNGTCEREGKIYTNGGRVVSVTSLGSTIDEARENIYKNIDKVNFEGIYYRSDIGKF